jgi:hypothetical protein
MQASSTRAVMIAGGTISIYRDHSDNHILSGSAAFRAERLRLSGVLLLIRGYASDVRGGIASKT